MNLSFEELKKQFQLNPEYTYLNHGSFGACPIPIFEEREKWQRELEFQPVSFIERNALGYLRKSRESLSEYVHCDKDDIVYFPNPTTAMNMVIRSLDLNEGDEVLSSNHEYGAVERTWKFMSTKRRFKYTSIDIPLPFNKDDFIDKFQKNISNNTKVIFLSHITSPTGIVFPIKEICKLASSLNIMVIIDGAHAPAQIDLNLSTLGADIYTGACHKWMLCPKGVSFLYASKKVQDLLEPLIISWGWESEDDFPRQSNFLDYHQYQGTNDISSYLSVPAAINFLNQNNWISVRDRCHEMVIKSRELLLETSKTEPICSDDSLGQMASIQVKLPKDQSLNDLYIYFQKHKIEIPVIKWNGMEFIRISFQCYNSWEDIEFLNHHLNEFLHSI
tara:strand:- start:266 stop:1432 length:1167 start_codon:yes stop_codon:yes gene_type:complete